MKRTTLRWMARAIGAIAIWATAAALFYALAYAVGGGFNFN